MREILFRGKRVDNNQWTEGFLSFVYTDGRNSNGFIYTDKARIYSPVEVRSHDVYTATVGQFIGLCDKNGVKIFEGDVLRDELGDDGIITYFESIASFRSGTFRYRVGNEVWNLNEGDPNRPTQLQYTEVIGNIYDKEEQDALQVKFAQDGRCTFDE